MTDISADVKQFADVWSQLTPPQRRFVVAMQEYPTKKEAAVALGISPNTVYNWPSVVDDAIVIATNNVALATLGIITANATKAAMVKVKGMDSYDEKIAQAAATEILDRNIGKPVQRQELSGADGNALTIVINYADDSPNNT